MKKSTCPVVPMGQVRTLIQSTPIFRQFSENSYKAALLDLLELKPFDILNDRVVQEKLVEVFNSIVTNYVLQSFSKPESLVAPLLQLNGMEYPVIYSTNTELNTDITNMLLDALGVEDAISTIINKYGTLLLPSSFDDLSEELAQKIISIFEEMDFKPILTPSKYLTTQGAIDSTLSMNLFNQNNTKFSVYFPSSKISQAELNKLKALRLKQIYSEGVNAENTPSPNRNNDVDSIEEDTESSIDQIEEEMNSIKAKAIADGTFMLAPNGNPTNLTERQWLQVRTKAFKKWFGDWEKDSQNASKVVDENGEPLVVYHGGSLVNKFDTSGKKGRGAGIRKGDLGVYFTSSEKSAKNYEEIHIYKNGDGLFDIIEELKVQGLSDEEIDKEWNSSMLPLRSGTRAFFLNIKNPSKKHYEGNSKDGYKETNENVVESNDGQIITRSDTKEVEYVAKNPNQIKSATDNIGTFDNNNPDIRYSKLAISVYYALLERAKYWVFERHMPLRVFNVLFHTNLQYNKKNDDKIRSSNPRYRGITLVNKNDKRMEIKRRVDRVVVLDYLSKKFNLKYQVVSDDYYKTLTDDVTSECMIIGDTVYLRSSREDKYSPEQIIEEFLHPVVNTICKSNPELANKLIKEAREDFPDLISQIEFLYRRQSKEVQNEEIITQVLSKYLNKEISNNGTNSRSLFTYIKAFFEKIFNLFNKTLFNEIIFTENDDIKIDGTYIKDVLNYEYLAKIINTKGLSFTDTLDSSEVRHHKKEEGSLLDQGENILRDNGIKQIDRHSNGHVRGGQSGWKLRFIVKNPKTGKAFTQEEFNEDTEHYLNSAEPLLNFLKEYFANPDGTDNIDTFKPQGDHRIAHYQFTDSDGKRREPFKFLSGGEVGESDFTIYIGSMQDVKKFISDVEKSSIKSLLAEGNNNSSDTTFSNTIHGRIEGRSIGFSSYMLPGGLEQLLPNNSVVYTDNRIEISIINNEYVIYDKINNSYHGWSAFDKDENTAVGYVNNNIINIRNSIAKNVYGSYITGTSTKYELYNNLPGPETKINIYAGTGENADLSNFAERPFVIENSVANMVAGKIKYFSVEQAFQLAKFTFVGRHNDLGWQSHILPSGELMSIEDREFNTKLYNAILASKNSAEIKKLGSQFKHLDRNKWDANSSEIMKQLIKASFEQNPQALQRLLATGNATLTHTQDKGKWGTEFPRILMEVREELRQENSNNVSNSNVIQESNINAKVTTKEGKSSFTVSTSSNSNYTDHTEKNIEAADITVVFAIDFNSKGTKDTIRYAEKKKKGVIQFTIGSDTSPEAIERIIKDYLTKAKHASKKPSLSINIAGNGITSLDKYDITQDQVDAEVLDAIKQLQNYITISSIRSGGQTGVDEAGIKAGLALGIPTHVHAPKGFRFRVLDRNSESGYKDISNRDQFLSRFTGPTPTMKGKPIITKANKLEMKIANLENYADILSQESAIDTSVEHTVEPSILDKELPNLSERTDYINYVRTIYLNGFNTAASIMENILESLIESEELTEDDSIRSTIKVRDLLGLLKSKSILDRRKAVIQYSKVFADPIIERSIPSAALLVDTTEEVSKTFQSSIDIVRQGIIASYFNLLNAYTGSTEEKLNQLIEDLRGEEILDSDKFFFNIDGNTDEERIEDLTYALVNCGDSYISTLALVAPDLYHYMNQVGGNNLEEAFRSFMAKQFDLAERFKNNDLHTALLEEASVTMRKWDGLDFSIQQIEQENPDEDADATEITDETRDDAQMADYEVRVKNVDPKDTLSEQLKLELSNLYTRRKAAKNSTQFVFNSLGFRVKLDPADAYGILKQTLGEGIYDAESFLNAILQLKKTSVSFAPFCDRIISYKEGTSFTQDVELRNALYGAIVSFTDFRVFDANYRLISKNNSIGYREALSATRDRIKKDKGNTQTYYNNSSRDRINPTSIKKDRDELSSLYKNLYALVKEYYTKKTIDDSLATTVQKNLISTTNKLQTVFAHMGAPFNPQQIKEMCPTIEELLPEAVKDVDTHLRNVLKIFITVSNYLYTFYDTVKGKKESLFTDLCSGYLEDLFKQLPYKRITSHRNSSFRYDNKSRQSYSSPDAIQLLRDRVQNSTLKDLKEYLNNEFGKYRFFQTIFGDSTNIPFSNPVLNDIYNGHTRLFDFVNILGTEIRNGKKGPITRISAGKTENWIPYFFIAYFKEFEETGSTSSYSGYAHYRFPLLSDNDTVLMFNLPTYKYVSAGKDSVSVIQADSEHRSMSIYTTLRDMIMQEILRIMYVTNNKVELSKRFPVYAKKGQEFCFFPELNTLELSVNTADIGEEIRKGTLIEIVNEFIDEIGNIGNFSSKANQNKITKVIDVAINQLLFGVNDASILENVSSLKEGLVGKFIQKYQDSLSEALTKYIEVSPVTTRAGKTQQNNKSRSNSLRSYEVELKQKKTNITLTQDAELAAMVNFYLNDFINQLSLMQIFGGDMAHVKSYEEFVKRFKQYYAAGRRLYPNAIEESQDNATTPSEGVKVRQEKPLEERCLYLEDAYKPSLQIANFTELLKNDNLDTAAKRVISDISDICTTDGQSFRTLSSVRKIFKAMGGGMWTKELEDAFNFFEERINDQAGANTSLNTDTDTANSKVSAQSISYLNVLLNAIKPMVSSYENITMPGNRSEKVIVQHKNSEYVISALYSVLNVAFNSSPQLLALHAAMQDGNIDVVHFRSVVKRGDSNIVDINYDVAKFDAEVKANRGVILGNKSYTKFSEFKEALDKKLVSGTISSEDYTNYLSKYEYKLEDENGKSISISDNYTDTLGAVRQTRLYKYIMGQLENPRNIHTIPLSDYMIIQPSGDHLTDQTALEGSQLRNIVPADLPEDAEIEVELTGLMIGGKPAKVKLSKASILKLYDALHCDSYLHDFNDLKKDFSSVEKLRDRLIKMTLKDEQWGEDSRRGLEIVDGTFKIPLASFVLSNKTNSLLFSMVKNSIQRQKVLGGNAVLASAFGISDKLQIQWKEDSRGNKTIDYIPCMVAQSSMKYLEAFAESHPDGTYTLSLDKAKKVLGEDSPLFKSIAYRIPTEDKYSMFRLKIVGFMPQAMGSSIILPDEVVALSGTDFDIDKLFFMLRSFTSYYHSKKLGQEFSRLVKISKQITNGKEFSEDTFDIQGEFIEYLDEINTTSDSEYIKQCDSILSEIKDKDSKHVQTAKTNIQNRIKRFTQELNDIIEKAANRSGSTVTNFQINEPTTYNDLINLYLELTRKRQLYKECTSRMNPEEYAIVEDCLGDLEGTMYYIQAEIIRNYLKKFTTKGSTYDDFANLENQSLLFKVFMDYVRDSDNEREDNDKLLTPSFELEYPSVSKEIANSFNSVSEEDQLNVLLDMSRTASDSARNNMLIDVCDAILTSKEGSQLSSITATFESLRETSRMNRILHDSNALKGFIEFVIGYNRTNSDKIEGVSDEGKITNIQLALSSTIKKLGRKKLEEIYDEYAPTKNPADIGVWNDTRSNLMAGNSLIGITAVNSSNHYKFQFLDLELAKPFDIVIGEGEQLNTITISTIDNRTSTIGSKIPYLIGKICAEYQAAAPDNGKDPTMGDSGISPNQIVMLEFLMRCGIPITYINLFNRLIPQITAIGSRVEEWQLNHQQLRSRNKFTLNFVDLFNAMAKQQLSEDNATSDASNLIVESNSEAIKEAYQFIRYQLSSDAEFLNEASNISRCDSANGALASDDATVIQQVMKAQEFWKKATADDAPIKGFENFINPNLVKEMMKESNYSSIFEFVNSTEAMTALRNKFLDAKIPRMQAVYSLGHEIALMMISEYFPSVSDTMIYGVEKLEKYIGRKLTYRSKTDVIKKFCNEFYAFLMTQSDKMFSTRNADGEIDYSKIVNSIVNAHQKVEALTLARADIEIGNTDAENGNQNASMYSVLPHLGITKEGITISHVGDINPEDRKKYKMDFESMLYDSSSRIKVTTDNEHSINFASLMSDIFTDCFYTTGLQFKHNSPALYFSTRFLENMGKFLPDLRDCMSVFKDKENAKALMDVYVLQFIVNTPSIIPTKKSSVLEGITSSESTDDVIIIPSIINTNSEVKPDAREFHALLQNKEYLSVLALTEYSNKTYYTKEKIGDTYILTKIELPKGFLHYDASLADDYAEATPINAIPQSKPINDALAKALDNELIEGLEEQDDTDNNVYGLVDNRNTDSVLPAESSEEDDSNILSNLTLNFGNIAVSEENTEEGDGDSSEVNTSDYFGERAEEIQGDPICKKS